MYFFNKTNISEKSNVHNSLISRTQINQKSERNFTTNEQKQSLQILKDKGFLTETEYKEKIEIIDEQIIIEIVHKSIEYHNLKKVYESKLLTKEQFNQKTNKLVADYKEYNLIFGENYSEFTWELYKVMKLNKKINPYDYDVSDLFRKWKFKEGQIFLYKEQNLLTKKIKVIWTSGLYKDGEWELENQQLNVKLDRTSKSKKLIFRIDELGSHIFVFYINENRHTCIKDLSENTNVW